MGESKRRKETLGEKYGKEEPLFPWFSFSKTQMEQFGKWTSRGTWAGIALLVLWWLTVRVFGPALGWWQVN
jgi:Protein of unknown function (DUF2839)